jgi:serpin B
MRLGKWSGTAAVMAALLGSANAFAEDPAPDGQAAFAADLYRQVIAGEKPHDPKYEPANRFFSPYSVRTALSMAGAGAAGATLDQIDHALHLKSGGTAKPLKPAGGDDDFHKAALQLNLVNALWGQAGYPFLPGFKDELKSEFGAEFSTVDFAGDPEAVRASINQWGKDQTHGKIPQVLPAGSVVKQTRLVLADAIYFKAKWAEEFSKSETVPKPFHLQDGSSAQVPMMHARPESEGFLQADGCTVVSKPYLLHSAEMVLVIPDDPAGLPAVEQHLTGELIAKWTGELPTALVELQMPKFGVKADIDLKPVCRAMGITDAFEPKEADFSKIAATDKADPLFIGGVYHSAFVSVDEEGTEAAAVTAVAMAGAMAVQRRPVIQQVVADRPFLFLVVDRESRTVLFMGRVSDPR